MASSARLKHLNKRLQPDIDALPNRTVSPEAIIQSESDSDDAGGVSLEPFRSFLDASSEQGTPELTDSRSKKVETHPPPDENHKRRFILVENAESSYNPKLNAVPKPEGPITPAPPLPNTDLQRGDLASTHHHFTPIQALARYPYKFCDKNHMQDIASAFFDQGKFWEREWDLYYVWDIEPVTAKPIILVRESQFIDLLEQINHHLQLHLRITNEQRKDSLVTSFPDHPRCRPRYLGRSYSREEYDKMVENTPGDMFRAPGERAHPRLEGGTLGDFKQLMEELEDIQKAKSKAAKLKKQQDRLVKQTTMADQFKRTQRYLGLRPTVLTNIAQSDQLKPVDPLLPVPFMFEQSVVFVCIDIESFERDHKKITEVGVATLDTRELVGVAPGIDGAGWRKLIRAQHLLINEYRHLKNTQYVIGHPDKFRFGETTPIALRDVAGAVAACFHAPFGAHDTNIADDKTAFFGNANHAERRNIIFLGHDPSGDIRYLRQLGYDPMKTENILEALDTAVMYRVWRREQQSTSLGRILNSFGIDGWYLHNAGNDAVFTAQAMLAICVREATIRGSSELRDMRIQDKAARLASSIEEARQRARDEAEGWSDNEVEGDGGAPVPLTATDAINPIPAQTSHHAQHSDASIGSHGHGGSRGRGRGRAVSSFEPAVSRQNHHEGQNRRSGGYHGTPNNVHQRSGRGRGEGRSGRRARSSGTTSYGSGRGRGQGSFDSSSGNAHPNSQTRPY